MTDTPQILLAHHLKALKLPTFLRKYDKVELCASSPTQRGVDAAKDPDCLVFLLLFHPRWRRDRL